MKAIFTGLAAFAVVLAVQPASPPVQNQRTATPEQIEAAVDSAKAEAGTGVD